MIKRIKLFLYFFKENTKFDVVTSPVRIWIKRKKFLINSGKTYNLYILPKFTNKKIIYMGPFDCYYGKNGDIF